MFKYQILHREVAKALEGKQTHPAPFKESHGGRTGPLFTHTWTCVDTLTDKWKQKNERKKKKKKEEKKGL